MKWTRMATSEAVSEYQMTLVKEIVTKMPETCPTEIPGIIGYSVLVEEWIDGGPDSRLAKSTGLPDVSS